MRNGSSRRWLGILGLLLLLSPGVAGCIAAPVRMSPELQGPPGVSADHTFIRVGQTTRQEVLQRLGWADVGLNENRLFWGRWTSSSSGTVVVVLVPGAVGGERNRNWSTRNLMVEFDDRDVVLRVIKKVEDKDVVRELVAWSERSGYRPADPSSIRNSFAASAQRGTWTQGILRANWIMKVGPDSLEFIGTQPFTVPRDSIVSLEWEPSAGVPRSHRYTLKLKDKTPWGREIHLGIANDQILPILAYITPGNL